MTDIKILHKMIVDRAQVVLMSEYHRKKVELTEPNCSDSAITISGVPENGIVIDLDRFWLPEQIFKGSNGQLKRADFVIVANDDGKKVIIYIELKRRKGSKNKIVQQLTGAQCFITYCREIGRAEAFWNQSDFLENYKHRFVSISHTSISMQKTRVSRSEGVHDHPKRMLKISSPHHLEFNHIAGWDR